MQAALDKLRGRDDWLLWIDFATLLPPWEPPPEYQQPYFEDELLAEVEDDDEDTAAAGNPIERPSLQPIAGVVEGSVDPQDDELFVRLRSYAAALTYLDGAINRILDHLAELLE